MQGPEHRKKIADAFTAVDSSGINFLDLFNSWVVRKLAQIGPSDTKNPTVDDFVTELKTTGERELGPNASFQQKIVSGAKKIINN